jgi:hypothetical protein
MGMYFIAESEGLGDGDDSCLENDDIELENEYLWNVFPPRSAG